MSRIEDTIIQNLLGSEKYCRVVVPHLKTDYFADNVDRHLIETIVDFFGKHHTPPTSEIISIELRNKSGISDKEVLEAETRLEDFTGEITNHEWLVEQTEEFCKERSLYNAIRDSIPIMNGTDPTREKTAIPQMMQEALAVSFDTDIGHDYFDDAGERYDLLTSPEDKIPFDLDELNKATKGGMKKKAMYCAAAESAGGKSIFLCHTAAATLKQGKNVLYITLEMSEEYISQRIDANLMNVSVDDTVEVSKDDFLNRIEKIRSKTLGKLKVKEFAPGAHSGHFRALLEEYKAKQGFVPDLLVIDYLGICGSARMRMGGSVNTNTYLKAVAEELRGLGKEYNMPVLTAVQINRDGYGASDLSMKNIAESIGIVHTLDFFFALIQSPELTEVDQVMIQILKNRHGLSYNFIIGLTKRKMQFYNLETSAQDMRSIRPPPVAKNAPKKVLDGTEPDLPIFNPQRDRTFLDASQFNFED
jgi:replicative DNA helicase